MDNLICSIKAINGATDIPISDYWRLTPPLISHIPSKHIKAKKLTPINANQSSILHRPIIDNEEKLWHAIKSASDINPKWGNEEILGTDALAWYASFHRTSYWGIYIPYSGLLKYASNFLGITQNPNIAIQLAWDGLIAHESIHYGIDVACAQLETISNLPIYLNGQFSFRSSQGHIPEEEQIAEAALLRFFKGCKSKIYYVNARDREAIYNIVIRNSLRAPSGYRDGIQCITPKNFTANLNAYLHNLCHQSSISPAFSQASSFIELSKLLPITTSGYYNPSSINYTKCPIYVFDDNPPNSIQSNSIHFITQISQIQEGPGFMDKVGKKYLNQWIKTKQLLGNPDYPKDNPNLDFKRWPQEDSSVNNTKAWSVRVGKTTNMRAHINENLILKSWIAIKFGNADKMGHHKNRK